MAQENLKPRQISDALYHELGKKIMGQISDKIWKVIRNETTKEDIRGTMVESIYDRVVNPNPKEDVRQPSPVKNKTSKQNGISAAQARAQEANMCDDGEPHRCHQVFLHAILHATRRWNIRSCHQEQLRHLPSEALHNHTNMEDDDNPLGFAIPVTGVDAAIVTVVVVAGAVVVACLRVSSQVSTRMLTYLRASTCGLVLLVMVPCLPALGQMVMGLVRMTILMLRLVLGEQYWSSSELVILVLDNFK